MFQLIGYLFGALSLGQQKKRTNKRKTSYRMYRRKCKVHCVQTHVETDIIFWGPLSNYEFTVKQVCGY